MQRQCCCTTDCRCQLRSGAVVEEEEIGSKASRFDICFKSSLVFAALNENGELCASTDFYLCLVSLLYCKNSSCVCRHSWTLEVDVSAFCHGTACFHRSHCSDYGRIRINKRNRSNRIGQIEG